MIKQQWWNNMAALSLYVQTDSKLSLFGQQPVNSPDYQP